MRFCLGTVDPGWIWREGVAVMGSVGRDITYTGGSTSYHGTTQHWGSGDNVAGDKRVGGAGDHR